MNLLLLAAAPYHEQVVPALRAFSERGDSTPMVSLLRSAIDEQPKRVASAGPHDWPPEVYAEDVEVLEGRQPVPAALPAIGGNRSELIEFARAVSADLAYFFCTPRDLGFGNPQDLSRGPLPPYLYRHSAWILGRLTWEHPFEERTLEVPFGEHAQELAPGEARRFQQELSRVPRPTGPLSDHFDELTRFLAWAVEHASDHLLVVSVG